MKQKIKAENLIHVKLDFKEAVQSRQDLLTSQMNIINALRFLRMYKKLRLEELKLKLKLNKNIKELKSDISKLQRLLPEIKIPDILKEDYKRKKTREILPEEFPEKDLESQLKEIQEKLRAIQK